MSSNFDGQVVSKPLSLHLAIFVRRVVESLSLKHLPYILYQFTSFLGTVANMRVFFLFCGKSLATWIEIINLYPLDPQQIQSLNPCYCLY